MSKEEGLVALRALLQESKFDNISAGNMILFGEEFKELKLKYGVTRADLCSELYKLHPRLILPQPKTPMQEYLD